MRNSLLLACLLAACFSVAAKDTIKGRIVNEVDRKPVAYASITVEYPDTIVRYEADRKGRFRFEPMSFPFTVAAKGEGMSEAVYGLMSMPSKGLVLQLAPDPSAAVSSAPARKPDWSTAMTRRLTSKFIVRSSSTPK
ncbi:MAG: carboxypeptidase-like regulatory domain-containing protein [Muribaculaceae bacterium]|nr:carboxypeptidase-like regulatory domain-containing protein [Muribaculaceae bacterium]